MAKSIISLCLQARQKLLNVSSSRPAGVVFEGKGAKWRAHQVGMMG